MKLDEFLLRLSGVRKAGKGFKACCPAHNDQSPSLSIEWKDGRILVKCFAGCATEDVVRAMGLTMSDLFDDAPPSEERARAKYSGARHSSSCRSDQQTDWGALVETYDYYDAEGKLLHFVERTSTKQFPQGRYQNGMKVRGLGDVRTVLYRLPKLLAARLDQTVYIVEGEKDVHACEAQGLLATCNCGGAGKFRADHAELLRGRHVVIVMDKDQEGEKHARKVLALLQGVAESVRVVQAKAGKDAHDHFAAGHTLDEFEVVHLSEDTPSERGAELDREVRADTVTVAFELLAKHAAEFWNDGEQAYMSVEINGSKRHVAIGSSDYQGLVTKIFYSGTKRAISDASLGALTRMATAKARFEGPRYDRSLRIGWARDAIYLALFDDEQRAVRITKDGWEFVHESECPMRFVRGATTESLPTPVSGNDLEEMLRKVLNVDEAHLPLVTAFLTGVFLPTGTFPVLVVTGQQGSGKSFGSSIIRNIVDPQRGGLQKLPRDEGSLMATLYSSDILAYDNVSRISDDLSDSFCSIASGTGFSARRLYTNLELVTVEARKPIILNGIGDVINRPDLMDRSLVVSFRTLRESERKGERELLSEFRGLQPALLGAVLDRVSRSLHYAAETSAPGVRLLDFARWAIAGAASQEEAERLREALVRNRSNLQSAVIDNDIFAQAVIAWIDEVKAVTMTASEILAELNSRRGDAQRKVDGWPTKPESVSKMLSRIAPVLEVAGIQADRLPRTGKNRPGNSRRSMTCNNRHNCHDRHMPVRRRSKATTAAMTVLVTGQTGKAQACRNRHWKSQTS